MDSKQNTLGLEEIARAICASLEFDFIAPAGHGAFKETFHVRQSAGGPSQALKVHRPGALSQRAEREIDAMLRCSHPNIGTLFAVQTFQTARETYLFSLEEYLPGGTLSLLLQELRSLEFNDLLDLGSVLIDALGHIAERNLVHRDLKPDNIMFREDRVTPVIVDFGLVRSLGETSLTQSWNLRGPGTPLYAPPEQLNNEKHLIDWRSDQFALGVVLSYCLNGCHPYQKPREARDETVDRVAQREHRPRKFEQAVNVAGLPVLYKMTAPWPIQRYRLPSELKAAWESQRS